MKNILLPTDFSSNSINAIQYALNLFQDSKCLFYLINVYTIPYLTNEVLMENDMHQLIENENKLFNTSQEEMKAILKKIKPNNNHKFELISEYGFFIDSIKKIVKNKNIDLIIMGTKGATGAKEIFMGSNTGDIIMKTNCNILAVPENASYAKPKEITFPTDFKITYKKEIFTQLVQIAELHDSNIRVLLFENKGYLDEDQKINKKSLDYYLKKLKYTYHTLTNNDFEVALNCFTQSRGNTNMIAIIAKHYNFFQRLFFKPKVESLSFHTQIPLLVLQKK